MQGVKWEVFQIHLKSNMKIENPFWDVQVEGWFVHEETGTKQRIMGFYYGKDDQNAYTWQVRWTPTLEGVWNCSTFTRQDIQELNTKFKLHIGPAKEGGKGFLRADPHTSYGFRFDNGEPFFLFGDTMYNLFGAHYCSVDVDSILRQRKSQGINYIRARLQVSPYHPDTANSFQIKDCWPWGGSSQLPDFTKFNLDYFQSVDEVIERMTQLEMGLEMVLQGWLFEFPFNDRGKFIPEYEEMWNQYIVSRYAAYTSIYIWCPANEYEFYPSGKPGTYNKESNRWLKRLSEQIRKADPYAHPIGAHNWEKHIPLSERLAECDDIEVYLVQTNWGCQETEGFTKNASLCIGLETEVRVHAQNKNKITLCSEFGYEKTAGLFSANCYEYMDSHHTRRGQWRAGFSGYSVVHGFNNTWAPHMRIDLDSEGTAFLLPYYEYMTEQIMFHEMRTSPDLLVEPTGTEAAGTLPLCISNTDFSVISVYFPASGQCKLKVDVSKRYSFRWYNPRSGMLSEWEVLNAGHIFSPVSEEEIPSGDDWVLLVKTAV